MESFPISAAALLPHTPPMLCIDSLVRASAAEAEAVVLLGRDHVLLEEGVLHEAGYVELAAQTAGAMQGYMEKALGRPVQKGFLASAQKFSFWGTARQGDFLRITVGLVGEVGGVSLLEASICRDTGKEKPELLAQGRIKVFVPQKIQEG